MASFDDTQSDRSLLPESVEKCHEEILRLRKRLACTEHHIVVPTSDTGSFRDSATTNTLPGRGVAKHQGDQISQEEVDRVIEFQDISTPIICADTNIQRGSAESSAGNKADEEASLVLEVVLKIQWDRLGSNWDEIYGVLRKYRLVCVGWRNVVDEFLQKDATCMKLCPTNIGLYEYRKLCSPVSAHLLSMEPEDEADRVDQYIEFLERRWKEGAVKLLQNQHLFIECHRESSSVDDVEVAGNWKLFTNAVQRFLEMFAETVTSLTVVLDVHGFHRPRKPSRLLPMYSTVCQWLGQLSNLKSLSIITSNDLSKYYNIDGQRESLEKLVKIPFVRSLQVFQSTQLSSFAMLILLRNSHVKKLCLGDFKWPIVNFAGLTDLRLSNLRECTIHMDKNVQVSIPETCLGLQTKTLHVCLHHPSLAASVPIVPFTRNVVTLILERHACNVGDYYCEQLVSASFLRHLVIRSHRLEQIDWTTLLQNAPLLETINVKIRAVGRDNFDNWKQEQGFWAYMKLLQQGSYWYFVPRLKKIHFVLTLCELSSDNSQQMIDKELWRYGMPGINFVVKVNGASSGYFVNYI